jgi:hypothetical protein
MQTPDVVVLSTYESYLPPTLLRSIGRSAVRWGIRHKLVDLAVEALDASDAAAAKAFVVSIPLFDSIRPACAIAKRLRDLNPRAPIFYVGAHALLHRDRLEAGYHGRVVADVEEGLRRSLVAAGVEEGRGAGPDGVRLPPLQAYTYPGGLLQDRIVANVETTRGCRFACTHCTVFTLARGSVEYRPIPEVMQELRELVGEGADHVTFLDAEFMNDGEHGPAVVEAMHREFPGLTFDVISRVDRILEHEEAFRRFFDLGCEFVTTAIEFPDDEVLRILRKGYRTRDLARLARLVAGSGFRIAPTLIVFSPWIDVPRIRDGERFLAETGLDRIIDPVQRSTRLVINKGSPLLETDALRGVRLVEREFTYDWTHPDPAVEALYAERLREHCRTEGFKRCCVRC